MTEQVGKPRNEWRDDLKRILNNAYSLGYAHGKARNARAAMILSAVLSLASFVIGAVLGVML